MYCRPHRIWAVGSARPPAETGHAALGILVYGSACGMPYALDVGLSARLLQPDSRVHSALRSAHSAPPPQPNCVASCWPSRTLGPVLPGPARTAMAFFLSIADSLV